MYFKRSIKYLNKEQKYEILSWNWDYKTKYIYPRWFLETKIIQENNKNYLVLKLKEIPKYRYPRLYLVDWTNQYYYIRVIPKLNEIKLDQKSLKLEPKKYQTLKILNWNWDYKIYKNNENILVEKVSETEYRVYGKKEWTSILKVEDSYGKSKSIEVKVEESEEEQIKREFENNELQEIFKLFWLNDIEINSAETEQWKQEALKQLNFTKEKIKKLDSIIEKIVTKLTNKFSKKLWYVKTIRLLQKILEKKKTNNAKRNALIDYINYSFEEYIEDYENKQFRWNVDNPFSKYYAAHLKILWREAEIDIEVKLMTKLWVTRQWMDEQYGWIFSKKWLEFLKTHWIITQEEYTKYVAYTPTVDWLLKTLEQEWSIHSIAKQYFPDKVWAQDWFNQAVKDYLSETIEVLDPRDIPEILYWISRWLKKVVTWDYNIELAKQKAKELYELYANIDEIVSWLEPYKKSFYKTYVWTNFSLSAFPVSRLKTLKKIKWGWDSKVMKEVKELKRKRDDKKKDDNKNRVIIKDIKAKIKARIDHIMKIEMKTNSDWEKYFNWVHSNKAILNHPYWARIEIDDINKSRKKANKPYNAKVFAKDKNWNEIMKKWYSSFFPDSWDRKIIMEEVEYAVRNNEWHIKWTRNTYKWISKSWIEIHFYLEKDWRISSYFPNIK